MMSRNRAMATHLTMADKGIFVLSVILLYVLFSMVWSGSDSTRYVSVFVDGEKRYLIDLFQENILEVEGRRGVSKLEIVNGKVRFIESPCSTHFCIRSGWLDQTIGLIACLPNGISLSFSNANKAYDAINF